MSASVESQPQLPPSGIPVPSGIKRAQSRSPDLAGDRRHTTEGDHSVGHKKKMFGHRRTHSHETNVVHGSKAKSGSKSQLQSVSQLSSSVSRRTNPTKKRVRLLSHFDAQSLCLSVESLASSRSSTSTDKVASGASSSHTSVELGTGGSNGLVSLCPRFANEIGGEWFTEVNGLGIVRRSLPKHMRYKVFSHLDNLIFEGDVVPEHWLPYSSNRSMDEYSRFSGASQETVKRNAYPVEFVDYGAAYYRQYYLDQEHFNYFGIDENLGPVAISLKREKNEESIKLNNLPLLSPPKVQYRFIVRTGELQVLRGSVYEETIMQSGKLTKSVSHKDVVEFVSPEIQISCLKLAKQERKVMEELTRLDEQELNNRYKIGILYCSANQFTEEDMYNNENGSPAFDEFLEFIGQKVKLKGFNAYRAGLDTKTGTTGQYSVYTKFRDNEIMFHVSTLLPYQPHNRQQLQRKRHIGNDIVTIIFQDPGAEPFSAKVIRSQFQHVFIVVTVHNPNTPRTEYSVAVTRLQDVPYFGPALPEKGRFKKNQEFREFLITKLINAENAGHRCDKFMQMATRTRQAYLQELATQCVTQQTIDTGSSSGLGILRGLSRRKDKASIASRYLVYSLGAVAWSAQLLLESSDNQKPQPLCIGHSNYSNSIDVIFALSIDSLVLVEVKSKQVILHIPTTCINGWNSVGSRLNVYFDGIQCISLDICEMEEVEDVIGMVEARLQSVSPHASKAVEMQLPLSDIAVMSVDNGLILNPADQETLKQGDIIVQVGSVLTCVDQHLFGRIKKSAHNCDELAHVFVIQHNADQVPPVVHSVKRAELNWKSIWSMRPDLSQGPGDLSNVKEAKENGVQSVAKRRSTDRSSRNSQDREIPGPGSSTSIPIHSRTRQLVKPTRRTFSYIQAVNREQSTSISQAATDSDGDSSVTNEDSPDRPLEEAAFTDSDEGLSNKETDAGNRLSQVRKKSPLANNTQAEKMKHIPTLSRGSKVSECAENKTSPWRKGRVQELRAVFAQNNGVSPPPLPSTTYLNATGTPDTPPTTPGWEDSRPPRHSTGSIPEAQQLASSKDKKVSSRFGFTPRETHLLSFSKSPSPKIFSTSHKTSTNECQDTIEHPPESSKTPATSKGDHTDEVESAAISTDSVRIRTAIWESKVSESSTRASSHKPALKEPTASETSVDASKKGTADSHFGYFGNRKANLSGKDEVNPPPNTAKSSIPQKAQMKKDGSGGSVPSSTVATGSVSKLQQQRQLVKPSLTSNSLQDTNKLSDQSVPKTSNMNSNNNRSHSSIPIGGSRSSSQLPVPHSSQVGQTRSSYLPDSTKPQTRRTMTLSHPAASPHAHQRSQSLVDQNQPKPPEWKKRRSSGEGMLSDPRQSLQKPSGDHKQSVGMKSTTPSHISTQGLTPSIHPHSTPSTTKQNISSGIKQRGKMLPSEKQLADKGKAVFRGRQGQQGAGKYFGVIPRFTSSKQEISHNHSDGRRSNTVDKEKADPDEFLTQRMSNSDSNIPNAKGEVIERWKGVTRDAPSLQKTTMKAVSVDSSIGSGQDSTLPDSTEVLPVLPLPPPDQSHEMSDLSSCSSSSNEQINISETGDGNILEDKLKSLKKELDKERRGKEELQDAMLLMKKELSLLREMRAS